MHFYKIPVSEKSFETKDSVSLHFKVIELPEAFTNYHPGQHLTLKLIINGKEYRRSYSMSSAPMISVRLQELLGVLKTPSLLDQRLKITVELLAPNYRPTQITGDLENFWKTSYQDVRKDLRARYPKHDWPENPLNWTPEMSKRFKK